MTNVAGNDGVLTRRQYYAANARFKEAPGCFLHTPFGGRPTPPDPSSLSSDDLVIFNAWWATRENGARSSQFIPTDYSSDVLAMMALYEAYVASPAYANWALDDLIGRDMQWRVRNADILEAVEAGAVIPISADPAGAGANALVSPVVNQTAPQALIYDSGSGNFVIPPGSVSLIIEIWGAGGGGRSGAFSTTCGGGGGGYSKKTIAIDPTDWNTNFPYSIGGGGAGHSSGSAGNGSAGGNTTAGSVTLNAGTVNMGANGGAGGTTSSAAGGSASGGDTNIPGGYSTARLGGTSPNGGMGGGLAQAGYSPGGGGAGGDNAQSQAGGNGANGRAKFTWS